MALAIFDLDETLISSDSDYEWGQYIAGEGLVNAEEHKYQNNLFYQQYKAGLLDVDEYFRFACSVLKAHPPDFLKHHLEIFITERIEPVVLPKAIELVDWHRNKGNHLMVITSTIEFITRPIVDIFGIETLIAPIPEFIAGRYTGKIEGVPSFGPGKVICLNAWLKKSKYNLEGSFFYSDSHNDLPLLRQVDHPIAVDPDPLLRQEAKDQKWPIVTLR